MRKSKYLAFLYFFHSEWDSDIAMTSRDVGDAMGIGIRHVRYYLVKGVNERRLACIKFEGRSYYVHRWVAEPFIHMDKVRVIRS